MTQYIYFVKCPNCEDEHFDFFDEAKEFALGCLSQKPVITQIEVCRNDFGECTDSTDLGTIWSWEDMMKDMPSDDATVFSKSETLDDTDYFNEFDEFTVLDNVPDNYSGPAIETAPVERKPIPDGMTVKDLVEAMEENEDQVECVACEELHDKADCTYDENHGWLCADCQDNVVECTWCNELYDRSECRYEVNLEWLCSSCEAAIKSRGETLTFKEGSYWDFLDEDVEADTLQEAKSTNCDFKFLVPDIRTWWDTTVAINKALAEAGYMRRDDPTTLNTMLTKGYDKDKYPICLTSFNLDRDTGRVILQMQAKDMHGRPSDFDIDLEDFLKDPVYGNKSCETIRKIAMLIRQTCNDLMPGVRRRRELMVAGSLTPEIAEEFKNAITRIHFTIPDGSGAYEADDFYDMASEEVEDLEQADKLAEEAADALNNIYDNFMFGKNTKGFAQAAVDAGMVSYRDPFRANEATIRNFKTFWGVDAVVYLNKPICELSKEAQELIEFSKFHKATVLKKKGKKDEKEAESQVAATAESTDSGVTTEAEAAPAKKTDTKFNGYKLACALINYFNNDVKFYDTTVVEESVATKRRLPEALEETLEEAEDYRARLSTCNECGEKTLDESAGLCINCGAYSNKESLAEDHTPFVKPASLKYYFDEDDAKDLEELIAKAVETCKAETKYPAVTIEIPYGHLRNRTVREYICKAMEEEGFPGASIVSYDDGIVVVPVTEDGMDAAAKLNRLYGNATWDNPTSRGNRLAHNDQAITQPNMQPKNNPHAAGRQLAHNDQAINKSGSAIDYGKGSLIEPKQQF